MRKRALATREATGNESTSIGSSRNLVICVLVIAALDIGGYFLATAETGGTDTDPKSQGSSNSDSAGAGEASEAGYPRDLGTFVVTCYVGGTITRTGTTPDWGTVAVDPSVIKLGSKLTISKYPGKIFRALDTGKDINGRHIDVWFSTLDGCKTLGKQDLQVTQLTDGGPI